jgi:hypothetical protein
MFVHWKKAFVRLSVCPFVRLSDYEFAISNSVKYFLIEKYNSRPWSLSPAKADDEGG